MVKQTVPVKSRTGGKAHAGGADTSGSGKKKHGGIGSGNAFENLTYRSKHSVLQLGKPKGKLKRPAMSQSNSLAQRQASLLTELGSREKANSFVDDRLAEGKDDMNDEDRTLLRFQKERQKRLAANKFSMDDGPEVALTHGGLALSTEAGHRYDISDDNPQAEDEDQQEAELARRDARDQDAMGDEEDDGEERKDSRDGTKSRHEVMSEVMLKSKMFRAERSVMKGEQDDLMGHLDADFDDVRNKMEFVSNADRERMKVEAKKAERDAIAAQNKARKKKPAGQEDEDAMQVDPLELDPTDEFVLEARQLGLDLRARATDRLKTDDELIKDEKKRLERLEKFRLKRQRGEQGVGEAEEEENEDESDRKRRRRGEKEKAASAKVSASRRPTDDDLNENFVLTGKAISRDAKDETDLMSDDEEEGAGGKKKKGKQDAAEEHDDDDDSEDDDGEDGSEDDDGEDGSDDEDSDGDDGAHGPAEASDEDDAPKAVFIGANTKGKEHVPAGKKGKDVFIGKDGKSSVSNALLAITAKLAGGAEAKPAAKAAAKDSAPAAPNSDDNLPFTFPAPASYKDFRALLALYPAAQHSVIIHRIKTCHHVSLAPENKQKMEKFFAILLAHFRRLAQDYSTEADDSKSAASVAALVARLDEVGRHLAELAEIPSLNGVVGRAFRAQLVKIRAEIQEDPSLKADQLLLFKLLASLFPTSDFRHNVSTPLLLLVGEILGRAGFDGRGDLVRGAFLSSVALHAVRESKRLVPEILTWMHAALVHGLGIQRGDGVLALAAATGGKKAAAKVAASATTKGAPSSSVSIASAPLEAFSITPSALRLHSSLQSRNQNFTPSPELACWASLLAKQASSAAAKSKKTKAEDDVDLHIPLQWLFCANDAAVFSAASASASPSLFALTSFSTLLQLIHQSAQLYSSLPSYAELFVPIVDALGFVLSQQKAGVFGALPTVLQQYVHHLHSYLGSSIAHSISLRTPLEASLAPLALKTHQPLFVEGYNPTKDYDPIKERAHMKELSAKLKREKKGALRELRRDTAVVVSQQRALQDAHAAERETKRKEVWQQMEEQQRDTNIMAKESKKKERKEGGKKGSKGKK